METLGLTELETKVLTTFIGMLNAEPTFSDVVAKDLATKTELPINTIKGVIGSLTKKGIIYVEDYTGDGGCKIIYLSIPYFYLHPDQDWKEFSL